MFEELYAHNSKAQYIQSVLLERSAQQKINLTLVMVDYPFGEDDKRLEIRFYDVRELKLDDISVLCEMLINIEDISDRKWENCSYKVTELEEDAFSFYCGEIEYMYY